MSPSNLIQIFSQCGFKFVADHDPLDGCFQIHQATFCNGIFRIQQIEVGKGTGFEFQIGQYMQ